MRRITGKLRCDGGKVKTKCVWGYGYGCFVFATKLDHKIIIADRLGIDKAMHFGGLMRRIKAEMRRAHGAGIIAYQLTKR